MSAVKRKEEVETLPCSLQVWSTPWSVSMLSDQQPGLNTEAERVEQLSAESLERGCLQGGETTAASESAASADCLLPAQ